MCTVSPLPSVEIRLSDTQASMLDFERRMSSTTAPYKEETQEKRAEHEAKAAPRTRKYSANHLTPTPPPSQGGRPRARSMGFLEVGGGQAIPRRCSINLPSTTQEAQQITEQLKRHRRLSRQLPSWKGVDSYVKGMPGDLDYRVDTDCYETWGEMKRSLERKRVDRLSKTYAPQPPTIKKTNAGLEIERCGKNKLTLTMSSDLIFGQRLLSIDETSMDKISNIDQVLCSLRAKRLLCRGVSCS